MDLSTMIADYFRKAFEMGRKQVLGRFVIPSGIRCVRGSVIGKCFTDIPGVGVITTKSLSFAPRPGYREPIYARFLTGSYINAVGLSNPGAELFLEEMKSVHISRNKFLLVSIFGADADEFRMAAETLEPIADGFELNMSCPHAAGYGIEIGQDVGLVTKITNTVINMSRVPVFVKLSATLQTIGQTAKAAIEAGASGITVSNSIGPSIVEIGDTPILHNRVGGLSGNAIRPLALFAVRSIRSAVGPKPTIISMGGIGTAEHIMQFKNAGADLFGVGSALTGLDSASACSYFSNLEENLTNGILTLGSDTPDTPVPMDYHQCHVVGKRQYSDDLFELRLNALPGEPDLGELSGRYYFLCIPSVGEKPFAVFSPTDRSIIVRTVGVFTGHLAKMPVGGEIWVRGPYGHSFAGIDDCKHHILVGGGTGTASLLDIGYRLRSTHSLQSVIGARSKRQLFGLDSFAKLGPVTVATDDGTCGYSGRVSDVLQVVLQELSDKVLASTAFVNCGPAPMVHACIALQQKYVSEQQIVGSIEYDTSCGVGICGKCASPDGHLSCIDGPFLPACSLVQSPAACGESLDSNDRKY
jgi:dihydroorotate dehydrogenase (NAD+) catalytic subunit